jgi:hypothetical protein
MRYGAFHAPYEKPAGELTLPRPFHCIADQQEDETMMTLKELLPKSSVIQESRVRTVKELRFG